jgi:hypothetical protein
MVPGVVSYDVARFCDLPHQIGMPCGRGTHHEERAPGVVPLEQVQEPGSEPGIGPVVEREGDQGLGGLHPGDAAPKRELLQAPSQQSSHLQVTRDSA